MKLFKFIITFILINIAVMVTAQMAVNADGSAADNSAMLDVKSTNRGLLLPRLTTVQIIGIQNPVNGLMLYNTDSSDFYGYDGVSWIAIWGNNDTLPDWLCGSSLTDARDGKVYETVQIGSQCWMQENLNVGTRINGDTNQTNNAIIEKYCYNNSEDSCDVYGGLYQFDEALDYVYVDATQGICPDGWHVPSDNDWKTMEEYLGMAPGELNNTGWRGTDEGNKLKETGTSHWASDSGATNSSGYTALPGGFYDFSDHTFNKLGAGDETWTSSSSGADPYYRHLLHSNTKIFRNFDNGSYGRSVRCVKD